MSCSIAAFSWTCFFALVASHSDVQAQSFDTPRSFEAKVVNGEKVGWEQRRLVHLKGATNEMILAVPDGLRVEATENKVTLTSPEATFFLNFRLRIGALSGEQSPNQETARKRVLDQYAGAKILDEYQVGIPGRSGRGYELRWSPAGMTERFFCQIESDLGLLTRISSRYALRRLAILSLSFIVISPDSE